MDVAALAAVAVAESGKEFRVGKKVMRPTG
jgi:hypothetical protein